MNSLKNKLIWVTGASRGIGASIARNLADEGASLALSASSMSSFKNIMADFTSEHKVAYYPYEISSEKEAEKAFEKIKKEYGEPWALINNAGIGIFRDFTKLKLEELQRMIEVNLYGSFIAAKLVLPSMKKNKSGVIINILTIAAKKAFKYAAGYSASKMAVMGMSGSLREEVRESGIKVIDIFPGATETEIWDEEELLKYKQRMIQPYDIAQIVADALKSSLSGRTMIEEIVIRPQLGDL